MENNNNSEVVVKRSSSKKAALWLAAFVVAFSLWFYVSSTVSSDVKYTEKNLVLDVDYKGLKALGDLEIRNSDFDIVSIAVYGEDSIVKNIQNDDIKAYIDLSEEKINGPGTYKFDVKFDTGDISGITCTRQSIYRIELVLDKTVKDEFSLLNPIVDLSGCKLPSGYKLAENPTININKVLVEGWALDLEEIAEVHIEAEAVDIDKKEGTQTVKGKLVLYNSAKKKIENDDLHANAYKLDGGIDTKIDQITITVEVVKDQ